MPTYRLDIEYNGTAFYGWQVQPDQRTVQGVLEGAAATVLREPVRITGSGRTDTGVHARGQVAHVRMEHPVDPFRLRRSLNGVLPDDVVVLQVEEVENDFHARYDARKRLYHYQVCATPRALDRHVRWLLRPVPNFELMNEAAAHLLGTYEFSAFCRTRSETENRICTLERACWLAEDRPGDWRFEIEADRFLHGMVRAVVGTLVEIGRGNRPPDDIPRTLATGDRREAGPAAPAHGLILQRVLY